MALEAKATGGGEGANGQRAGLFEVALYQGSLTGLSGAQHVSERRAVLSGCDGIGELSSFSQLAEVNVAVHGQRVQGHGPVCDDVSLDLKGPGRRRCANASSNWPMKVQ